MSSVYKGQADSVQRGVALLPSGEVLIRDQLTGLAPDRSVRWGMITPATAKESGTNTIQLEQDGKSLTLSVLEPVEATWKVLDTSTPRNPWDSPNRGTRMVALECDAPDSGRLTYLVLATPGQLPTFGQRRTSEEGPVRMGRTGLSRPHDSSVAEPASYGTEGAAAADNAFSDRAPRPLTRLP